MQQNFVLCLECVCAWVVLRPVSSPGRGRLSQTLWAPTACLCHSGRPARQSDAPDQVTNAIHKHETLKTLNIETYV